jgi:hypothetical protein
MGSIWDKGVGTRDWDQGGGDKGAGNRGIGDKGAGDNQIAPTEL